MKKYDNFDHLPENWSKDNGGHPIWLRGVDPSIWEAFMGLTAVGVTDGDCWCGNAILLCVCCTGRLAIGIVFPLELNSLELLLKLLSVMWFVDDRL